jgi:hypothetical protein
MALAGMIALDEDALICDLAEVYGIYEYKAFHPSRIATFAGGLSVDSRIKMALSGAKIPISQLLQAVTADKLANLVWMQSKDGVKGRNKPTSVVEQLRGSASKPSEIHGFDSPEEFQKAWQKTGGDLNGQS